MPGALFAANLEPLAGAALALNVGFLGLHRFEYRRQIVQAAREQAEYVKDPGNCDGLDIYKDLMSLANLDFQGAKPTLNGPALSWWYGSMIHTGLDRKCCVIFSFACMVIIWLGAISGINYMTSWHALIPDQASRWAVWFLTVAAMAPPIFWRMGQKTVQASKDYTTRCREQIQSAIAKNVKEIRGDELLPLEMQ